MTASPCAKVSTKPRDQPRQARRQHAFDAQRRPAEALGVAGEREEHDKPADRRGRREQRRRPSPARTARDRPRSRRADEKTKTREQQQHGHQIQQPLEDDRRKRRRRRSALAPRQQVRAQHFAGAAGSRELAAKPITVVSNAFEKRVGPIGARRYCQRNARSA